MRGCDRLVWCMSTGNEKGNYLKYASAPSPVPTSTSIPQNLCKSPSKPGENAPS